MHARAQPAVKSLVVDESDRPRRLLGRVAPLTATDPGVVGFGTRQRGRIGAPSSEEAERGGRPLAAAACGAPFGSA
eukprot:6116379-Prymnesium_polylepis.1